MFRSVYCFYIDTVLLLSLVSLAEDSLASE